MLQCWARQTSESQPGMSQTVQLSASLEDYLEAILHLLRQGREARVKDIAKRVGVHKSSVTGAMRSLSDRNLVNYAPYGDITLTRKGERVAREIARRHEAIQVFFTDVLGIDPKKAEESACRIEHALHSDIVERMISFADFIRNCPRGGSQWIYTFRRHCEGEIAERDCEGCVVELLEDVRKAASGSEGANRAVS